MIRFYAKPIAALAILGCASAPPSATPSGTNTAILSPAEQAKSDRGHPAYTPADVHFMQGMIGHHAQALVMAAWAPTHGASSDLRILAERIDVAQRDEIAFMQRWLRERNETVPSADAGAGSSMSGMNMPGMNMSAPLMPGMLTHEQMMQLDAAKDAEFDRLFLTFMIQHHNGALTMVNQLFSSRGAGQDINIFRFASDVSADQSSEIARMTSMLSARSSGAHAP